MRCTKMLSPRPSHQRPHSSRSSSPSTSSSARRSPTAPFSTSFPFRDRGRPCLPLLLSLPSSLLWQPPRAKTLLFHSSPFATSRSFDDDDLDVDLHDDITLLNLEDPHASCCLLPPLPVLASPKAKAPLTIPFMDEEVVDSVVADTTPSHAFESHLGDWYRAAAIQREALQRTTSKSLAGLQLDGFDYESILGQCCEMPVGYVQIPLGTGGLPLLDGREYWAPISMTEGCLVASTNRGCKAIYASGGATSVLLRDGMSRAPVVMFPTAAQLKIFLEDPRNFEALALVFNRSSRCARLQSIKCAMPGKNLYIRCSCSTGDAMGMNMASKGVQNVLDVLGNDFPDMDVVGMTGNFCSDKKAAAVSWIDRKEGANQLHARPSSRKNGEEGAEDGCRLLGGAEYAQEPHWFCNGGSPGRVQRPRHLYNTRMRARAHIYVSGALSLIV